VPVYRGGIANPQTCANLCEVIVELLAAMMLKDRDNAARGNCIEQSIDFCICDMLFRAAAFRLEAVVRVQEYQPFRLSTYASKIRVARLAPKEVFGFIKTDYVRRTSCLGKSYQVSGVPALSENIAEAENFRRAGKRSGTVWPCEPLSSGVIIQTTWK
jgi:hypothetical protein